MEMNEAVSGPDWAEDLLHHTQIEFTFGLPREEKRALIEAFELGKVIEWQTPDGVWHQWDYRDLAGEKQPELGHIEYARSHPVQWRVPEQEQVTVRYRIGIAEVDGEDPYAVAYVNTFTVVKMRLLVDRDDTEHSTTYWRVKYQRIVDQAKKVVSP